MKGIQEFLKDLETNEELAKEFEGVEKEEDIVKLAKEKGYEFTKEDYMDAQMDSVSGGIGGFDSLVNKFKNVMNGDVWSSTEDGLTTVNNETGAVWRADGAGNWNYLGTLRKR